MNDILAVFNEIATELLQAEQTHPVVDPIPTAQLYQALDLSLNDEALDEPKFQAALKSLVLNTPRTATSAFFNQLFGGRNPKAVLGDLLAVLLNNSMYTYKVAGPMVGVEKVILRKVCEMIGWDEQADGTFASGGSLTNLMSMLMARDAFNQEIIHTGVTQKMTVYTSAESHYSIPKNAAFSGIGRDQVRYIPVDSKGRMNADKLASAIDVDVAKGFHPVLVNITAGTTVLGAFDPIESIGEVCKTHGTWLHVDGAYCGSVLFSKKYRHLIGGVEQADSFSFNPHKMMGTPLTCSVIVVKDKAHLYHSFANEADYLYQTDHDEYNLGKTSLQCGRRNDALKFWTLWKSVGTKGLEQIVDKQFELADTARNYIRQHTDYKLYSFDESIGICFNYKDIPARNICTLLYEKSKLMVGYGNFNGEEFIRLVTINAGNEEDNILNFFSTLEAFVSTYEEQLRERNTV